MKLAHLYTQLFASMKFEWQNNRSPIHKTLIPRKLPTTRYANMVNMHTLLVTYAPPNPLYTCFLRGDLKLAARDDL